ncbi:MAG: hypothetical protein H0X23_10060, partial [Rubrobacter sp.]|nr:hypothetical protein [Rubrobacter sp.]
MGLRWFIGSFFASGVVRRLLAVLVAVMLSLVVMGFAAKQNRFSEAGDRTPAPSVGEIGEVPEADSEASSVRPNILLITTDDMDERSMENFPDLQQE